MRAGNVLIMVGIAMFAIGMFGSAFGLESSNLSGKSITVNAFVTLPGQAVHFTGTGMGYTQTVTSNSTGWAVGGITNPSGPELIVGTVSVTINSITHSQDVSGTPGSKVTVVLYEGVNPPPKTYVVTIQVSSTHGSPVAGIGITLVGEFPYYTTTTSGGFAELDNVVQGPYVLTVLPTTNTYQPFNQSVNVAGDMNLAVTLTPIPGGLSDSYVLTIGPSQGEAGTLSMGPGDYTYAYNTRVTVSVTSGTLSHWTVDGQTSTGNSVTVIMSQAHTIVATFTISGNESNLNYSLTVKSNDGSTSTSPTTGTYTYASGAVVTVNATDSNVKFTKWTLDGQDISAARSTQVTMSQNHVLVAVYSIVTPSNDFGTALMASGVIFILGGFVVRRRHA